jgi:hypothetical protein
MSILTFEVGAAEKDVVKGLFLATLESKNWNRVHTAQALGVSLRTVTNRIRAYRRDGASIPNNPTATNPVFNPRSDIELNQRRAALRALLG